MIYNFRWKQCINEGCNRPSYENKACIWCRHGRHLYRMRTQGCIFSLVKLIEYTGLTKPNILEIGCFAGESSAVFAHYANQLTCIDRFENYFSGKRNINGVSAERLFNMLLKEHNNIRKIKGCSESKDIIGQIENESIDLLYIDGDHFNAKRDILNYSCKVKVGGFIAGHDYSTSWKEVVRDVDEIFGKPDEVFGDASWIVQKRQ